MSNTVELAQLLIRIREWCNNYQYRAYKAYRKDLFLKLFPGASIKNMICPSDNFLCMTYDEFDELFKKSGIGRSNVLNRQYYIFLNSLIEAMNKFKDG